jgi:hypothetical protein
MTTPDAPVATLNACALCQAPLPPDGGSFINGNAVCANCAAQVEAELAAEQSVGVRFPLAVVGGAAGAIVGALIWAAIVVATNFEVGYVAVLVGFLAGTGVKLGAGKGRSESLQALAAGMAFFGLAVSKYFILAHFAVTALAEKGIEVGYFSSAVFDIFGEAIGDMLSPFDLLWIFIALSAAWRVPAPSKVAVR